MRVHVLRNPAGGSNATRHAAALAVGRLRGAGHDLVELTGSSRDDSVKNLGSAIAAGDVETLLVAGGDGLVNLAIQHLAQTTITLLIAPTGTGNDFASALGLASDSSLDRLLVQLPRPVDLLRIRSASGDTWVASIAIAGFPATINARANSLALPIGSSIYTLAALIEPPTFGRLQAKIRVGDTSLELDSAMLAIGNTSLFGGGMLACPDAIPDDGLLHLTSIEGVGRVGILRHLQGRSGGTADRPEVLRRAGKHVEISTGGIAIWGDGEPIATTPATIDLVPAALQVHYYPFS